MREDDSNWFSKWGDELPSPEELIPLSRSLITPDLALAFNISSPHAPPQTNSSPEFDSPEMSVAAGGGGGPSGGSGSDEPARTLKRPRLVWTPQLHKRFVDAVAHLGIKNAVPKTIMQLMSVDGLTRENVASHLQKYRLYLKRMQGISNGGAGGGAAAAALAASGMDPATDHLFASSPVPPHFLHPGRANSDHFLPFIPVAAAATVSPISPHHHHQIGVIPSPPAHHQHQLLQQFRQFGSSPPNGQLEHPFFRPQIQRMSTPLQNGNGNPVASYVEDLESGTPTNGRKILTLFPTADD